MTLIDTHTHLYSEEFRSDRKEMIERALSAGVTRFFLPAIDSTYFKAMLETRDLFPENIFLMAGLHPTSVKENYKEELQKAYDFMMQHPVFGIGESGLDYYWDKTFVEEQKASLHQHCEWALQFDQPLVLHTRDSIDDTIDIILPYTAKGLRGIFHCFTGDPDQAKRITDAGFYLGIGGVVTFKNSGLDKTLEEVDMQHVVLETDSPYLAPAPFRGKRNESSYLTLIAKKIASIKGVEVEEVGRVTTANARKIFLGEE